MNKKDLKGVPIMFMTMRQQKQKSRNIIRTINREKDAIRKRINILRIDLEAQTTNNALTENECGFIVYRAEDDEISDDIRDARQFYNKQNITPLPRQLLEETDDEFNRRQFRLLRQLKNKIEQEDKKYE